MKTKEEAPEDIAVALAADEAKKPQDHTITLSTGVVLRGKQAPPLTLVQVMASKPRPDPPTYMNEKMGRLMENPDDPVYIERLQAWQMENSNKMLNALILLGTELVSVPKKFPGPESNSWLEEYSLLEIPMFPSNESWRYLTWIKFKAAPEVTDLDRIKEIVGKLSGIKETDVRAAETFPGRK